VVSFKFFMLIHSAFLPVAPSDMREGKANRVPERMGMHPEMEVYSIET
jgi:hypothetical protein